MAENGFFQIFVQYCVEHCPKAETYQIWCIYLKYGEFSILGVPKNLKKKAKSSAISYELQNSQKIIIKQHVHVITTYLGILKRILTCPSFKRWLVQKFKNGTGQAKVEKPKKCKKNYCECVFGHIWLQLWSNVGTQDTLIWSWLQACVYTHKGEF